MPAYFSIKFEVPKSPSAIRDFCFGLTRAGLVFKSGYWGFESLSFDEILQWNQRKLDENFRLGSTQHYSHGYRQMLFDYHDFSEVRMFVMNDKHSMTFDFYLIIPEDDFFEEIRGEQGYSTVRKHEKMDLIKELAKKIWCGTDVLAIQTGWECSDIPPRAEQISGGIEPQAEPFCIIHHFADVEELGLPFETIGRDGVLIEENEKWYYFEFPSEH